MTMEQRKVKGFLESERFVHGQLFSGNPAWYRADIEFEYLIYNIFLAFFVCRQYSVWNRVEDMELTLTQLALVTPLCDAHDQRCSCC